MATWACKHCGSMFTGHGAKEAAKRCEASCALGKNVRKEMRHAKAGEHSRPQALAIAYGKTRRAGYKIHTIKGGSCGVCGSFGHSTSKHQW